MNVCTIEQWPQKHNRHKKQHPVPVPNFRVRHLPVIKKINLSIRWPRWKRFRSLSHCTRQEWCWVKSTWRGRYLSLCQPHFRSERSSTPSRIYEKRTILSVIISTCTVSFGLTRRKTLFRNKRNILFFVLLLVFWGQDRNTRRGE